MSTEENKLAALRRAREQAAGVDTTWRLPEAAFGGAAYSNSQDWKSQEAEQQERLEARRVAELGQLDALLARTSDPELREKLGHIIEAVERATSIRAIETAIDNGRAVMAQASSAGAQPANAIEEKARLWGEIGRLNEKISSTMRPLMSREEQDKEDEFERRLAAARTEEEKLAIEKERHAWRTHLTQEWQEHGTDAQKRAVPQVNHYLEGLQKQLMQLQQLQTTVIKSSSNQTTSPVELDTDKMKAAIASNATSDEAAVAAIARAAQEQAKTKQQTNMNPQDVNTAETLGSLPKVATNMADIIPNNTNTRQV